jgi:phosphocarrier protein
MAERKVTVGSRVGLHARPASLLVSTAAAQAVPVRIALEGGSRALDARSILSVLTLKAKYGDTVVISAEGDGAEAALDAVAEVIATDHDAPEVAPAETAAAQAAAVEAAAGDGVTGEAAAGTDEAAG